MSTKSQDKQMKWIAILEDFNQSGKSCSVYCNEHSISIATFSYWKKKLSNTHKEVPEFVQVSSSDNFLLPFHDPAPITIHMGSIDISISDNCHPELLARLLGALNKYA